MGLRWVDGEGEGEAAGTADGYYLLPPSPWFAGDPDFLELGLPSLSQDDGQTEFTFWALFGGPMLLSTDIRNMSAWKQSVRRPPSSPNGPVTLAHAPTLSHLLILLD